MGNRRHRYPGNFSLTLTLIFFKYWQSIMYNKRDRYVNELLDLFYVFRIKEIKQKTDKWTFSSRNRHVNKITICMLMTGKSFVRNRVTDYFIVCFYR